MNAGDWITSVMTVATVVMAGATYYLAKVTKRLAEYTAAAAKQTERHHQENQRPFCVIAFNDACQEFPFGSSFAPKSCGLAPILVCGELQNKGAGPATDVFVYLNQRRSEGEDGAVRLTRPVFVSGLVAAGERTQIKIPITEDDIMHAWNGEKWIPTQGFDFIAGDSYEVVLQYNDVCCNPFRTVHPKGIWTDQNPSVGDPVVRERMMIRPNRPSPIFLIGTQAVRTLADVPVSPVNPDLLK